MGGKNKKRNYTFDVKKWEKEAYENTAIYSDICRLNENFIKDVNGIDRDYRHSVGGNIYLLFSNVVREFKNGYASVSNSEKVKHWKSCLCLIEDIKCSLKFMSSIGLPFSYGTYCIDIGDLERQLNGLIISKEKAMNKEK